MIITQSNPEFALSALPADLAVALKAFDLDNSGTVDAADNSGTVDAAGVPPYSVCDVQHCKLAMKARRRRA